MVQTAEAQTFLGRIASLPKGPGVNLDEVLQPSLDDEAELRRLLATDRFNPRLSNPYVGLVDVFEAPSDIRITRARVIKDDQDLNAKHVMPLAEDRRRKEADPCMVGDLDEFKKNWNIFSEGSLSQLTDWNNVIAAGGSVLACLSPLSNENKASKRAIRKHYHSAAYPTSDIDLFLWGLTPEQAERKIITIYEAVRDSVPWDVTCVRTKNTISIHSQYPYRSVQIVLRLYHSPAEVLAGFDIDAPCYAYDGTRVWANPRAIVAMMRQCNTTDVTRRSPSYEIRLLKYAKRGFEVNVPSLIRADVDPTIFERSIVRVEGLARLLVLEQLATFDERQSFLRARRDLRGRPAPPWRYRKTKRKFKNDLKSLNDLEELEMNDYDVASLHIPYGPGWEARRIDKLIYQTDLGMNSTFNPKNKGRRLHRHPAFFGTIDECIEDCCEYCPEPIDDAERELRTKEDDGYIRGRVAFMQENPGRQVITGSFKPIDVGEWSAQVYIGQTERIFTAIAVHDRTTVANMIKEGVDVNRRDHVGRSPLHFAILCDAKDIVFDLVDAGARMTARLVDGRSSLHLAVQYNQAAVVRKLLERSAQNQEAFEKGFEKALDAGMEARSDGERPSSEDDWSSEDDGVMAVDDEEQANDDDEEKGEGKPSKGNEEEVDQAPDVDAIPDDNTDEPDIFDLYAADWDFGLTPLGYAVIFASIPILEDLIAAGVDVKKPTQNNTLNAYPLTLTLLRPDEDEACEIAERLILAGATSSPADSKFRTIFYRIVDANKVKIASTILRFDPNANAVVNFPSINWSDVTFPVVLAIHTGDYSMTAVLLTYGARLQLLEEDITRAAATRTSKDANYIASQVSGNSLSMLSQAIETALQRHDDIIQLLVSLGADVNIGLRANYYSYTSEEDKCSVLDWVNLAIGSMETQIKEGKRLDRELTPVDFLEVQNWEDYATLAVSVCSFPSSPQTKEERLTDAERMENTKQYLEYAKALLVSNGAKKWNEIERSEISRPSPGGRMLLGGGRRPVTKSGTEKEMSFQNYDFVGVSLRYNYTNLPHHSVPRYHELYEACFKGDNEKIQALCLPPDGVQVDETPLRITVQLREPGGTHNTGVTPFSIAVERRKWDTARLILAIAVAQFEAEDTEVVFSVDNMDLDGDGSDDGSNYSDDSEATVEQSKNEDSYVDVAKRPSTVKCNVAPGVFFNCRRHYGWISDKKYVEETVFEKAIRDNDLESFVKLLNMFVNLPVPGVLPSDLIALLLSNDRHEMLDELIRRTGAGIDLKAVRHEAKDAIPTNDQNKLYLGLNVHGKKRADLATKHDPNAKLETHEFPLLWRALIVCAEKVIDYLASQKAYSAYRSYAMTHSDERAERLRSIGNLKELIPQWLGFRTNSFGESALTAAVLSGKVEPLKILFAKHKNIMKATLHDKYKPTNWNILQVAIRAHKEVDTALLDFLLAKGISPLETGIDSVNPYHFLCDRNNCRLLKHLLEKLPSDMNETLFKQQTLEQLKTPLHLAVEAGSIKAVEMLLARSHVANTIRDSDGCLPLHIAVRRGQSRIVKLLINAAPSTLFMEDGVGSTPFESASMNQFCERMGSFTDDKYAQVGHVNPRAADRYPDRFNLAHLEKELPGLRNTINSLLKVGKLRKDTKLEKELVRFAETMEEHMRNLQDAPVDVKSEEPENPTDVKDYDATHDVVREALNHVQGQRCLVHVLDVQKSVDGTLKSSYRQEKKDVEGDMLAEETEKENKFVEEHAFTYTI